MKTKNVIQTSLHNSNKSPQFSQMQGKRSCVKQNRNLSRRRLCQLHPSHFTYFFSSDCWRAPFSLAQAPGIREEVEERKIHVEIGKKTIVLSRSHQTLTTQSKHRRVALTYGGGPASHYSGSKQGHLTPSTSRMHPTPVKEGNIFLLRTMIYVLKILIKKS